MLPLVRVTLDRRSSEVVRADAPPALVAAVEQLASGPASAGAHGGSDARAWDQAAVPLAVADWRGDDFDLLAFDDQVWRRTERWGCCDIHLSGETASGGRFNGRQLLGALRQVLTRFQRFSTLSNRASSSELFARVLSLFERLHDRSKPLVAADHDHALDTWRWTLRLDPDASWAVQCAALFHDVERLYSEADTRVEQHASDYRSFKAAHARAGGHIVADLMARIDAPPPLAAQVRELVARHEASDDELGTEGQLLNEADALSFFSLNASGFLRYYGLTHTARKVVYTLGRLGLAGRRELGHIKLEGTIRRLVAEAS